MADEISFSAKLTVTSGNLSETSGGVSDTFDLADTSPAATGGIAAIGFAAHEALAMGDVSTAGWAYFKNLDATNFVTIGVDVSSTFYPFLKLKAGEYCICPLGTSAPYAKADTAAVQLQFRIYDA
jgi:hypothetical protein